MTIIKKWIALYWLWRCRRSKKFPPVHQVGINGKKIWVVGNLDV